MPEHGVIEMTTDQLWPRDEEHRYRIYALDRGQLDILATAPDPGGIGMALVTLDDDERQMGKSLNDLGQIGILDVQPGEKTGRWIVKPWGAKR